MEDEEEVDDVSPFLLLSVAATFRYYMLFKHRRDGRRHRDRSITFMTGSKPKRALPPLVGFVDQFVSRIRGQDGSQLSQRYLTRTAGAAGEVRGRGKRLMNSYTDSRSRVRTDARPLYVYFIYAHYKYSFRPGAPARLK